MAVLSSPVTRKHVIIAVLPLPSSIMKTIGLGIVFLFILTLFCACTGITGESTNADKNSVLLSAPTQLRLVVVPGGFNLAWKLSPEDPGAVKGYEIVRSDLASGPFARVATVDKGITQYIDMAASPETIYYYKVRAVAGNIYSPYSNTVTGER